jgi:uncharacterized membrane protein
MTVDWPYIHTLINHFPIILSVVGTAVLVVAMLTNRRDMWTYAVVTLTFAGLTVYPAFFSGDEAHEVLEHKWYVVRSMINDHEEAAELALWVVLATGVISAYTWWRLTKRDTTGTPPTWLRVLALIAALGSTGTLAYAALLGGRIIHESPRLLTPPAGFDTTGAPGAPVSERGESSAGASGEHAGG